MWIKIFQFLLAIFLGALIGLEREWRRKEAGIRTFSLISLGACLFTIVGFHLVAFSKLLGSAGVRVDPTIIIQGILVGIGFIGAGLIIQKEFHVEGLTTAAGLWVTAGIGVLVGIGEYALAVIGTVLIIGVLAGLGYLEGEWEKRIFLKEKSKKEEKKEESQ
ncbi:magnesium transporter MgtC [bacterium (Candidatus Gribaldobacteria) CG07_land_8_20_14_0_80_33_18]|uniref:Magnesium transporter MgtC n=1 Tax=bacterium (Candidatus Gribaldobacteria) CG07_land_8_20_14_0_80_33_18 TaxID=2014272 RepID=A0A2M6Z3V1_9BACT|nr:MAG: magnesium transporter MgtC [bacterium (Candidatus Gribaldobacteria) CG10_big_fil_rev_8_21_14_0_10_33_41]PIU47099.1 MAG: magnesium transporter MgtC [bacterium (Candidatus Gribaldobacteria) CG07_land_8_20_14_0_80_33_18]PJA01043.1 MAG: magnesium transporter MgtC [bacterium (Candidatus Gribaldobacteria) CG_4_10_14_0_2_um_filter_33_15]PJB08957.1 MAG: magnesium transporter MgtC [bacterium (Candidatus Gribaldobacteria) CG_4_9_14_3_um_filter_33_9]